MARALAPISKRKFWVISSLLSYGFSWLCSQERTQSHRGTVCQGSIWCYCGSLHHGATFYGDINLNHNYDELEQELG